MAEQDEDWQNFLKATEEDPDEVETDDELEDETEEPEEDDSKKKAKKSEKDEGGKPKANKDDESEEDDDSEEDEDDDAAGEAGDYKPRLKQFLNTDGTLNAEKIEKAYIESGKEAVNLNKKLEESDGSRTKLLNLIASKPEAAKLLFGEEGAKEFLQAHKSGGGSGGDAGAGSGSTNPILQHVEAQMNNKSHREYEEFVDAHPEAVTDPKKARLIGEFLKLHGPIYRSQHNGEIPGMKESLEAAYKYYGWDLEIEGKEAVATAAKKKAATRSTAHGGKKSATKKEITMGEDFFARKLGVKLK